MTIFEDVGERINVYLLQNTMAMNEVMIVSEDGRVLYQSGGVPSALASSIVQLILQSGNVISVRDYATSSEHGFVIFRVSKNIFVVVITERIPACLQQKSVIERMSGDLDSAYEEMVASMRTATSGSPIKLDASKLPKKEKAPQPQKMEVSTIPQKSERKTTIKKEISPILIRSLINETTSTRTILKEIIEIAKKIEKALQLLTE
ncbi:MAG: hypothetical protein QXL15_00915 [Candidatus Korarchaeota archaeon]